jgi:hypothetical protein
MPVFSSNYRPLAVVTGVTVEVTHFMKIDTKKLKNVTRAYKGSETVIIAQCPACAAEGYDLHAQNHLIVYSNGAFACALNPGEAGGQHRKEILRLVGLPMAASEEQPLPPKKRLKPRPLLNRIPTKITYIKLNIRPPQPEAEAAGEEANEVV